MDTAIIGIVYDLIFAALLVSAALLGRRRGFLASLILLVGSVLAILGVVTDPTTEGVGDSEQALTYTKPKSKGE